MMIIARNNRKGFSLLEMLLAVGIIATVMIATFGILQTYAQKELARSTVKYMSSVASAMSQILEKPANFNALYNAAIGRGGGYQLIADPAGPAIDNIAVDFQVGSTAGLWVNGSPYFNSNFRQRSPLGTDIKILLRITDDYTVETDTRGLEVILVTATPRPDDIVRMCANYAGAAGGFIRDYGSKVGATMTSAFSSWSVTPSNRLQQTAWYMSDLRNSLVANTDGSYLVYYDYTSLEDKMGDYLYRREDPSDPTHAQNTMYGPLNIGGNDIVGADDVDIGSGATPKPFSTVPGSPADCGNGVLCVKGTGIIKRSAYVGGFMTVNGNANVSDNMQARAMRIQNGMNATDRTNYNAQGLFVADGPNGVSDSIQVTGNGAFTDGMTVGDGQATGTTATTVTVPQGGVYQTNNITNTRRLTAANINAQRLVVDHQLKSGVISNGDVNVTGKTGVIDIRNTQNLVYGDGSTAKTLSAPRVSIENMSIQSFGNCTNGCGE